jgi:F-type H+-transporting ATPase subunit a
LFPAIVFASSEGNTSETIVHHLLNSDKWQPLPYIPAIPLPAIHFGNFTAVITVHSLMMIIASLFLCVLLIPAFQKRVTVPVGIAAAIEPIALFVRNEIVYPAMGKKLGEKWWPFFITVFLFLLTCNLMGLIPLFNSSTGNINVTAGMSLMILVLMFCAGIKELGPVTFIKNMMPRGAIFPINFIILFIELLGFFIKSFALCLRLFANMIAGHIVIISLLMMIFILHPIAAAISIPLALFINFLEILVAIIQALVFTLLSCIFIGMACHHH